MPHVPSTYVYGTTLTPLDFPTQVLSRLKHACKYEYCVQFATQITKLDAQAASTHSQEFFLMGIYFILQQSFLITKNVLRKVLSVFQTWITA